MTVDEQDEVRRILVAYQDAAIWCANLADVARRLLRAAQEGERLSEEHTSRTVSEIADTLRYLESNTRQVNIVRERIGL